MKKLLLRVLFLCGLCLLPACGGGSGSTIPSFGPATHFTFNASAVATAGTAFMVTVTARDATNNVVATYSGTVQFTTTDGRATIPANATLMNGSFQIQVTLITAGPQSLGASDTVNASITGTSNTINVSAGPASLLTLMAPANALIGSAFSLVVTAVDAFNNTATTYTGTLHFTISDALAAPLANSKLTNGVGNFQPILNTSGPQSISASDTVTPSITGLSNTIAVSGPATHFSFTLPVNATAGRSFGMVVTPLDASNNVATSYSGTVQFSSSDKQASLPGDSMVGPALHLLVTLNSVGNQSITATDTVTHSISTTSSLIPVLVSRFNPAGVMEIPRFLHTATLLNNEKVLVAGGDSTAGILASAELYDSTSGIFSPVASMGSPRESQTATLLANGSVLIAGGQDDTGKVLMTAELFDPTTGIFTPTGSMTTWRKNHTATLLSSGKVLMAGGTDGVAVLPTAELYDPSTGIFTLTGDMTTPRTEHTATALKNGMVLVAGGFGLASAELYNPSTEMFAMTGSMTAARSFHTATRLNDGTVLVVGGLSTDLYDPSSGTFTATASPTVARTSHTATLLGDGTVLITGGEHFFFGGPVFCNGPHPLSTETAELFNPASKTFTVTTTMVTQRSSHTATLLSNGKTLVTGGIRWTYVLLADGCFKQSIFVTAAAESFQ